MIKPLRENIIVEPIDEETTTKSGLIITTSATQKKSSEGKVVAVPKGIDDVKVGDHIYFAAYSPTEIKVDGNDYFVVPVTDIFGIDDKKGKK